MQSAINEARLRVWRKQPREFFEEAVIEADGGESLFDLEHDPGGYQDRAVDPELAALLADAESGGREQFAGRSVAVIQTGGNVDADVFAEVLEGGTPSV